MPVMLNKDEAHQIIDRMPPNATWDDLMRKIYVREAIERGLSDSQEGRTQDVKDVRAKFGFPE
jgi:hypothetical protein